MSEARDLFEQVAQAVFGKSYNDLDITRRIKVKSALHAQVYGMSGEDWLKLMKNMSEEEGTLRPHVMSQMTGIANGGSPEELYAVYFKPREVRMILASLVERSDVEAIRLKAQEDLVREVLNSSPGEFPHLEAFKRVLAEHRGRGDARAEFCDDHAQVKPCKYCQEDDEGFEPDSIQSPVSSSFGQALREARVAAGLSLRGAAELLGTTAVRMGEVERGVAKKLDAVDPRLRSL